jgi:hypothetical protein
VALKLWISAALMTKMSSPALRLPGHGLDAAAFPDNLDFFVGMAVRAGPLARQRAEQKKMETLTSPGSAPTNS